MADRNLPLGQITPVARPIGAFVQAAQFQPAAPARPSQLDSPIGISTMQTQGGGNVAGFNQFDQLATALAPFSKGLMELAGQGYVSYAKGKIEQGYYDQLKNQRAKAMVSLQVQAETGAADAASQIGQLQKVDPVAAQLLDESNPWKLIGRRRALAQLAGSEIEGVLESDLSVNAGELSRLRPDSPDLAKRQVQLTAQVLDRFQLTGEEPEVQFYVTPKLNKAWDSYRDQQRKFYDAAVEESTRNGTVAATASTVEELLTKGVTINGVTYKPGTAEWTQYGQAALTYGLDQQLRLLAPDARKRTVQFLREQIIGAFGGDQVAASLLQGIRGGDPSMPYEKRPTWGAMAPLETLELQVRGQEASQKGYDLRQKRVENQLDRLWYDGPGKLDPADPAYPSALLEFRNQALGMGYLTPEEYISQRAKDQSAFTQVVNPPDPFVVDDFITQLEQVGPGAWTDDPNSYKNALQQAKQIAGRNPTPEGRREDYQRMVAAINKARDSAGEFDTGVKEKVTSAVLQDLDSQSVREIKSQQKVNGRSGDALAQVVAQQLSGGATATAAISAAYQNTKLTAAANKLTNLYERALSTGIRNWKAEHPGQVMSPSARSVVMAEAEAAVRKSPQWASVMTDLTGRRPGVVGPAKVGTDPKNARGVPQAGAKSLSDETIRTYQSRPVMDGRWLRSELVKLQGNKPVSSELYDMARRANTSTHRYLLEQLRFYPGLDPNGDAKRWLQEKVKQQRANNTVSSSQLPSLQGSGLGMMPVGYNPLRPGGWLMRILTPPAAAATLPPSLSAPSSGQPAPTGSIGAFRAAIIGKESGGNYSAVNPDSGALGIGQVMPNNVGPWTQKYLGRRLTPQQFLRDRNAQDAVVNGRFRDMLADQQSAGYSGEQAIRRAAAVWYSGQAKLWNDTKPQFYKGRRYPSIAEYTQAIWESYKRNGGEVGRRSAAEPDSDLASQLVAQLSNERGYEDTAGPAVQRKPWAASPGRFADKGSFQNGLDAINKAGASITGFLGGNANDVELVRRFYTKNPQVANQYDLPVNLFLRYMSGIGAKGLSVSQEQGLRILKSIGERRRDSPEDIRWAEQNMAPAAAASYKRDIAKGMIPVNSFYRDNLEIGNSLGRFWAAPQKDGSFVITEDFNFGYAPISKGGDDMRAKLVSSGLSALSTDPMSQANRLVASGLGTPFRYRLRVYPDGRVQVLSPSK